MYRFSRDFTQDEEMPSVDSMRHSYAQAHTPAQQYHTPKPHPIRKPVGPSRAVHSRNAKVQPRDWHGRFASVGKAFKKAGKTVKKIKQQITPKYHVQRMKRTQIANEHAEARRQGFVAQKRQVRKRMPRRKIG